MTRPWIWLQLIIWVPVWALFVVMLLTAHPEVSAHHAVIIAFRMIVAAALLGLLVQRLTRRLPWPHPMRLRFPMMHLVAALLYSAAWVFLNSALASLQHRRLGLELGPGIGPFLVFGMWLYVMVVGVTYAAQAAERNARIEAMAARSQLAALRAQLNPHFLFNALHTVVQLIPREPRRAAQAAEQVAGLLRTTIEEDRDLVSLGEEWNFVERYLEVERIRFGDRLRIEAQLTDAARSAIVPSFSLQTLVENAVRHGAAPRIEPTTITVRGDVHEGRLTLSVFNTSSEFDRIPEGGGGTGLNRLRERLLALYGHRARLDLDGDTGGGFTATLVIPQDDAA